MFFRPDQSPWPVFPREFSTDFVSSIMTGDSGSKVVCVPDVEMALWILKNINPKHLKLAPAVGFEPTTNRLTADRSTTELRWNRWSRNYRGICLRSGPHEATANRLIPTASGLYH